MPSKTRAQLAAENAALQARLAGAEGTAGGKPCGESGGGSAEHARIEHALRASEIRYRRLFETAKDGILILDADTGRITDANPFLQELLGYSRAELLGRMLWEIGPFRDIAASREAFLKLQENEYIRYEDLPLETKDGRRRQVEFISNVYRENSTRVIQCNIRDITARHQAEAALQEAREELERQNLELRKLDAVKDAIIRDVSHELKTPVAKTAMQLELLTNWLEERGHLEEMKGVVGVMRASILRQETVIRNIMTLFRLESGKRGFRSDPVRLDTLLFAILEDYRAIFQASGIETSVDLAEVEVSSDGEMLWHVFSNLVNNAIKYRRPAVVSQLAVSLRREGRRAVVRFVDNGIGIDPALLARAFDPFFQENASIEGIGVGLTIARNIVERLGGAIRMESPGVGQGTAAVVELPLEREPAPGGP